MCHLHNKIFILANFGVKKTDTKLPQNWRKIGLYYCLSHGTRGFVNSFLLIGMKYFHCTIFRYPCVYIPFSKNMVSGLGNFFRILAISGNRG